MAERTPAGNGGPGGALTPRRIAALVLALVAVVFVFQNRADTTLTVFGASVTAPLWLFSGALLTVGILVGLLLGRRGRSA